MSEVQAPLSANPVVLAERIAAGQSFATLFREGMTLVELAAAYLDGPGRRESKQLSRTGALTYATEFDAAHHAADAARVLAAVAARGQ